MVSPIITPPYSTIHANQTTSQSSSSQNIPADILSIILEILSNSQTELYAPLICSHVCAHWHRTIIDLPSLWSYVDTSRGEGLTRLWLLRSKTVPIDVRLWENPLDCDLMQGTNHLPQPGTTASRMEVVMKVVILQSHRWRSLDIAFCDMRRITQFLKLWPSNASHLESLTVGPMGSTTLISHEFIRSAEDDTIASSDIAAAQYQFEKLNVSCDVLRIDTYPIAVYSVLFSSRLTVLEVFVGGHGGYNIDLKQWEQILLQTRNLVHLHLESFQCPDPDTFQPTGTGDSPFELPVLERLELFGGFALLIQSLGKVSFPKLEFLVLRSFGVPRAVGNGLAAIALASSPIRRLSIGTGDDQWGTILQSFHLLQEVTLLEMRWSNVINILDWLVGLPGPLRIRLEHIWDIDMTEPGFVAFRHSLPPIELVDCFAGGRNECHCPSEGGCVSENQSSYSDNSSFSSISHLSGYPSSEETDSDESERSYGEDEDFGSAGPM